MNFYPFMEQAYQINLMLNKAEEEAQIKRRADMQERINSLAALVFPDKKPRLKLDRRSKCWACYGTRCGTKISTQGATKEQAYAFYVERAIAVTKGNYFAQQIQK